MATTIELPDSPDRQITITGTIDEAAAENFIERVSEIDSYDLTMASAALTKINALGFNATCYSPQPTTVILNSTGGYVYDALSIFDKIDGREDLVCIATGKCFSAATIILLAFKPELRFATKNATFMLHSISSMAYGKTAQMEEDVKETKRLQKLTDAIYTGKSGITKELLDKIHREKMDLYMTAREALKYGMISKII